MEVAPNIVDATAVDLLGDVSDGDDDFPVDEAVPEFNPMDSDEEDDDAMSSVTVNEPHRAIEDAPRRLGVMGVSQDGTDRPVMDMTANDSDQERDRAGVLNASGPIPTGFVDRDTKNQKEGEVVASRGEWCQSQEARKTPQSIQDKVPNAVPASDFETPTTVPASSGGGWSTRTLFGQCRSK